MILTTVIVGSIILVSVVLLYGVANAWNQMISGIFNHEDFNESALDNEDGNEN